MIAGCPASGKSTYRKTYVDQGFHVLSRDEAGGNIISLLPKMETLINDGQRVVLDNTFPKAEDRKPFIELAHKMGSTISCDFIATSIEDAQINSLFRMIDRYGRLFLTADDIKDHPIAKKDPNIFPVAALFAYRKALEKPSKDEGFEDITSFDFIREKCPYNGKGLLLDVDGVLRETVGGNEKYPTKSSEMKVWERRGELIRKYHNDDYSVVMVSNQSGVAKGHLGFNTALNLLKETALRLGCGFMSPVFCPHRIPPVSCYCRKPQAGMGVAIIHQYKLNPANCIMVGDAKTDETFAKRLGFEYHDEAEFFKGY